MARVLFIWELGGGLGHLSRLVPVADAVRSAGHHVEFVVRAQAAGSGLRTHRVARLAPGAAVPEWDRIREPASYAEVLFNTGAFDSRAMAGLVGQWREILADVRPDVVVLDYAPFALLALQGWPARAVLLGTGFATPPDSRPLPDLRPWQRHYPDRLQFNEALVCERFNECLAEQGQPPLQRLAELFTRVDANLLATFPELDHYPGRAPGPHTRYVGTWSFTAGAAPDWPSGSGPRVFAYLKPFPALRSLLEHMSAGGLRTLAYLAGPAAAAAQGLDGVRLAREPVAIGAAAREADLAILNAGHGTTAEMLLAGIPVLQIPLLVEQGMVADRVEAAGAGLRAPLDDPRAVIAAFRRMLSEDTWSLGARAFARRHRDHDAAQAVQTVVGEIVRRAQ